MYLRKLEIELARWGKFEGQYVGKAEFENPVGEFSITLSSEISQAILKECAEALVSNARELAGVVRADILSGAQPKLVETSHD